MIYKQQFIRIVGILTLLCGVRMATSTDQIWPVYKLDTALNIKIYHAILCYLDLNFLQLAELNHQMMQHLKPLDDYYYEEVKQIFADSTDSTAEYHLTLGFKPRENEYQIFVMQFRSYLGYFLKRIIDSDVYLDVNRLKLYYLAYISPKLPKEMKKFYIFALRQYEWCNEEKHESLVNRSEYFRPWIKFTFTMLEFTYNFEKNEVTQSGTTFPMEIPLLFVCRESETNEIQNFLCISNIGTIEANGTVIKFATNLEGDFKIFFSDGKLFGTGIRQKREGITDTITKTYMNIEPWFYFPDFVVKGEPKPKLTRKYKTNNCQIL